jgi:serine/threonine protein kinase/tetratricopeptide (TPR) repeat protein
VFEEALEPESGRAREAPAAGGKGASPLDGAPTPAEADAGPYRILSEIGRGGMGVVYKAEDPRLARFVALKFVAPHYSLAADEATARLLAEARAASALDHPNICTIFDVGETGDGRLFFAMAYYQGRTLAQRSGEETIAIEQAAAILTQVARGLAHAHQSGVIHRDVKPSNILVTETGEVKILDFGLARSELSELTRPGLRLGTLAYMSPEQARGSELDHRTDIWSLGVVLHELLTGRHPLPIDSDASLLQALLNDDAPIHFAEAPALPPIWRVIAAKALERSIERRYRSMHDMLQDLATLESELRHRSSGATLLRRSTGAKATTDQPSGAITRVLPSPRANAPQTSSLAFADRHRSVGRELELDELRRAWTACAGGSGFVVCLTGEPGIGKTTAVEDFLAEIGAAGACFVARGQCSERLAGSEAYLPILEALESLLLRGEGRDLALSVMKESAPTWYVQIAPVPAAADPSFAQVLGEAKVASQERLKRELLAFLEELSRRRPVVLFCDDLHWADSSTVDLLGYIGSRVGSMRLLVIGTYRPSDLLLANHPFLNLQRELQSRGLCREIAVRLLDTQAIATYLDALFPRHQFPAFLPELLHSRTEGNPLFLTELLGDLRDRGVIEHHREGFRLARSVPALEGELPESVRSMIDRKVDRIDAADRRLLAAASVQGYDFDSATIAHAIGADVNAMEERLDALSRVHRFVAALEESELPSGELTQRYRFVHVLYHNALYNSLRPRQRVETSAAVAEALLHSHGARAGDIAARLAYLFETSRQLDRASDHFLHAAQNSVAVFANREAVELARRALENGERLEGVARHHRVLAAAQRLGQLHLTLSQMDDAIAAFAVAEKAAAELGDVEAQVNAICAGALALFNSKRTDQSKQEAERALAIADAAGSAQASAAAELVLALQSFCFGATDEAQRGYEKSVPVLRQGTPPLQALEAIGFSGLLYAWQLDYDAAERATSWTIRAAREARSPYHTIMNLFVRGMMLFNRGRLSEGLANLEEGMRLAEQNDERYWLSRFPNTLGWALGELGDWKRAHELNRQGAAVARQHGYSKPEANSHLNLAQHHLDAGEWDTALQHLRRAQEIFDEDFWFRWRYNLRFQAELASYWLRRGDSGRAKLHAEESLAKATPHKARKHVAWANKLLGDVAVAEARFEDARAAYGAALQVLAHHPCPIIEWKILRGAAEVEKVLRNDERATLLRARASATIDTLGSSITEERLRRQFLGSEAVRTAVAP